MRDWVPKKLNVKDCNLLVAAQTPFWVETEISFKLVTKESQRAELISCSVPYNIGMIQLKDGQESTLSWVEPQRLVEQDHVRTSLSIGTPVACMGFSGSMTPDQEGQFDKFVALNKLEDKFDFTIFNVSTYALFFCGRN